MDNTQGLVTLYGRDRILQRPIAIGVDIYPHYGGPGKSTGSSTFAVAILDGMGNIHRLDRLSFPQLLKLIHRHKPPLLAIDNVYELTAKPEDLPSLLSKLPPETRVIQVTGPPGGETNLQLLAGKHSLPQPSIISAIEEAETCARLANLAVGVEVVTLENETKILVCREVSLGPGGSSQSRFRRKVHVSILSTAKQIEKSLDAAGLDFDLFTEESDFGLERAEFTVYAPRTELAGLVRSQRGNCIQIKVVPVCRSRVEFVPQSRTEVSYTRTSRTTKLIVGIDPGTTCGLAILKLDGKPLYVESHRNLTRGDIVRILTEFGDPTLFAADVIPPPEFVTKLAKEFEATIFQPETFLGAMQKQELAREYAQRFNLSFKDNHSKDALVAAVKALNHYKAKFVAIDDELRHANIPLPTEEIRALVVKGYSVQRAIELLRSQAKREEEVEELARDKPPTETDLRIQGIQEVVAFYKQRLERLKRSSKRLKEQMRMLEATVLGLQDALNTERNQEMREIRRERNTQILQREIEVLRKESDIAKSRMQVLEQELESFRPRIDTMQQSEMVPVKPIETFTKEGLDKAFRLYEVRIGDIVLLLDSSGGGVSTAKELVQRGVRAVISQMNMAHQAQGILEENKIPVIFSEEAQVQWVGGKPYISRNDFEGALASVKNRKNAEVSKTMEEILQEYKRERELSRA